MLKEYKQERTLNKHALAINMVLRYHCLGDRTVAYDTYHNALPKKLQNAIQDLVHELNGCTRWYATNEQQAEYKASIWIDWGYDWEDIVAPK